MAKGREKCGNDGSYYNEEEVKENCPPTPPPNLIRLIRAAVLEYECILILLFTSNAYPSKPKIDGVGSAKCYEKKKNAKYISSLQDCD